eukprot:TRINITY_DN2022_c0_g1_i1.p1 TRINITY_DN2022_c0_g1~~TRINITY_DN2022_c0_g1_i1.p1  ORF type:complete len:315 (+),score=45.20 TRINITY_DN2022_c0_g1_i1:65-1009(+)
MCIRDRYGEHSARQMAHQLRADWVLGALTLLLAVWNVFLHMRIGALEQRARVVVPTRPSDSARLERHLTKMSEMEEMMMHEMGLMTENGVAVERADDEFNVRVPSIMVQSGDDGRTGRYETRKLTISERLRYLELKTNSRAAWGNYFDMESRMFQSVCQRKSDLAEFDPTCIQPGKRTDEVCIGLYDHHICLDGLKGSKVPGGKPCVVYDFGIREQPQFGVMMHNHFGCEVHAFDPSPISVAFYRQSQELQALKNYHFHNYGAGSRDGASGSLVLVVKPTASLCQPDPLNERCLTSSLDEKLYPLPPLLLHQVL